MKIIDQTPFFNKETGEISFLDRSKAMMKFGSIWIKEIEAQKQIIPVLGKILDKNFTLLRNVFIPTLNARFPFILIGPPGVFVMYVSPLTGMYRAKGDQWGTISGNSFKNETPNLLTRTERMARAIQIFLQRQGYSAMTSVDAILLCSDPSILVDTIRPIIRVILRDALERFAISLMQARVVLDLESVLDITSHFVNPRKTAASQPAGGSLSTSTEAPTVETPSTLDAEVIAAGQSEDPYVPAFALPESQAPEWGNETHSLPPPETQESSKVPPHSAITRKQWIFLITMLVFWCVLAAVFLYLIATNEWSTILSLFP
jgi:hypothetical protein